MGNGHGYPASVPFENAIGHHCGGCLGEALAALRSFCRDRDAAFHTRRTWVRPTGNYTAAGRTQSGEVGEVACYHVTRALTQGGVLHRGISKHQVEGGTLRNPAATSPSADERTAAPNRGQRQGFRGGSREGAHIHGGRLVRQRRRCGERN